MLSGMFDINCPTGECIEIIVRLRYNGLWRELPKDDDGDTYHAPNRKYWPIMDKHALLRVNNF